MIRLLTTNAERVGVSPVAFPSLSGCGQLSLCRLTGAAERVRYKAGCAREPAERNFPQPFSSHKATGKAPILSECSTIRLPGRAPFGPASHPFAQCAGRRWAVGLCPSSPALHFVRWRHRAATSDRPENLSLSRFCGRVRSRLRASPTPAGLLPFRPASSLVVGPPSSVWCVRRVPSGSGAAWALATLAPERFAALPLSRYAIPARSLAVAPSVVICIGRTSRLVSLAARHSRAGAP